MNKVRIDAIKPWISQRITQMLGFEDEVLIEFCNNQLDTRVLTIIFR